ncbi:MarR family winged helix-turn-helix transcriptional regulator [Streptomyces sp. NPDC005262]|uniref:MarR family winged helix-turn-helix transcriptional regulator n=1 Tax=Streptomyces sp. NPDC005262 TaxID=3364710 RepID=UPI0036AEB476
MAQEQQGLNEREMRAWRVFFQMQEVLRGRIEQQLQAGSDLSNADYTVLVALSEAPEGRLRAFELSRELGWEKSRLHHQLTRMCRRGLAERQSGPARAMYAAITPQGRAALQGAVPGHAEEVRRLVVDRLTAEQFHQLGEISAIILDGLREEEPAP